MKGITTMVASAILIVVAILFAPSNAHAAIPPEDGYSYACAGCPATNPPNHCGADWVYEYDFTCTYEVTDAGGSCTVTHKNQICNATDTCAGGTGLKAGLCSPGGCTIGGDYKVCCNGLTPVSCSGGQYSGTCGGATTIMGTTCTGKAPGSTNGLGGPSDYCTTGWYDKAPPTPWCPICNGGSVGSSCSDATCTSCNNFNPCPSVRTCDGLVCDTSCPDRNCVTDKGISRGIPPYKPLTFGTDCVGQIGCSSPQQTTRTVPNPPPACGWYESIFSDACADMSLPIDTFPNVVITRLCKECVFAPSSICGAQKTCGGRLASCGGVLVTGDVWERTGTAPAVNSQGDPYTKSFIHEPLQPLKDLLVQVVSSSHPTTCTSSNGTYSCTVAPGDDTSRNGMIKIRVSALGYAGTDHELRYSAGDGSPGVVNKTVTQKIYVDYIATTNTSPGNWTQVKGASYTPRGSGAGTKTIVNVMPIAPTRYDTTDAVPTLTNYGFNTGTDAYGAVTSNAFLGNYTKYSVDRDWHIDGYPMASRDVTNVYLQYVTKRRLTAYVANSYPRGSVVLVSGGTTIPAISDASFTGPVADGGVLFLVGTSGAPGTVTLGGDIITNTAVGVIAGTINVPAEVLGVVAVKELQGVFVAGTVSLGSTTDQGLKIIGNLSAINTFTNARKWRDTSRPSVYVQYDIGRQLGLLKNLSIASSTSQQEE